MKRDLGKEKVNLVKKIRIYNVCLCCYPQSCIIELYFTLILNINDKLVDYILLTYFFCVIIFNIKIYG